MSSLPNDSHDAQSSWPATVPRPRSGGDAWSACLSNSVGLWAHRDGSLATFPYLCKAWGCREHHGEKADAYLDSFLTFLGALASIHVGGIDAAWLSDGARAKSLDAVRKRAGRSKTPWVRVQAAGNVYVYFAGGDIGSSRASSPASKFVPVTLDEAMPMLRELLEHPELRVRGSAGTTPRWRSPDAYHRDSSESSGALHVAGLPKGKEGDEKRRAIVSIAVGLVSDRLTDQERSYLMEHGSAPPKGLERLDGSEWQRAIWEAGGKFKREEHRKREKHRHLTVVGGEQNKTDNEEGNAA